MGRGKGEGPAHIADAIRHIDSRGRATLLRRAGHIRHPEADDQRDHGAEEAEDGVSGHGCRGVVCPLALPDHGAACDDGQAAE